MTADTFNESKNSVVQASELELLGFEFDNGLGRGDYTIRISAKAIEKFKRSMKLVITFAACPATSSRPTKSQH